VPVAIDEGIFFGAARPQEKNQPSNRKKKKITKLQNTRIPV
jgi:hypothetical protein